ncbi:MAG: hypothetical protein JSV17_16540 [Candidatus Aminicenantes bacterium]|nr:MAG: hypothetical protein JSV17_16540 [Candidatus Aminicenantes bacterium]
MKKLLFISGVVCLLLFSATVGYAVEYMWIGAAAMTPNQTNVQFNKDWNYTKLFAGGADMQLVAPVYLPDGATINGVYFFFEDNNTTGHIYITLIRVNVQSEVMQEMFRTITTAGGATPGMQVTSDWTVTAGQKEVKNSTFAYYVHVHLDQDESAGNLRFHGVRIHYTL